MVWRSENRFWRRMMGMVMMREDEKLLEDSE